MIRNYKKDQIRDNYEEYKYNCINDYGECDMDFREYVEREAENDPGFFGWLFDDGNITDFNDLDDARREEYEDFLEDL